MNQYLTCNNCGWVHFAYTRQQAHYSINSFNQFYLNAPKETQEMYGGISRISHYEHCHRCGGSYKNFREYKEGDCPDGVTMSPIIREENSIEMSSMQQKPIGQGSKS